ncbi:unnamed protein product [Protopolystoma xenopodis]|uniref:Uncharacterized protein n=1 Tax=Protopolystoma xenopodis TaxID=117903 RepID=A0A448XFQ0_9PLAT|nr:unnamed protein product [Protopolystoma xenopodis]
MSVDLSCRNATVALDTSAYRLKTISGSGRTVRVDGPGFRVGDGVGDCVGLGRRLQRQNRGQVMKGLHVEDDILLPVACRLTNSLLPVFNCIKAGLPY